MILFLCFTDVVLKTGLFKFSPQFALFFLGKGLILSFSSLAASKNGLVEVGVQGALHVGQFTLHAAVPVVFYGVIGAAVEDFSNFGPLVIEKAMHQEENPLLVPSPVDFLDARVQVVVPPLSALLSHAAG